MLVGPMRIKTPHNPVSLQRDCCRKQTTKNPKKKPDKRAPKPVVFPTPRTRSGRGVCGSIKCLKEGVLGYLYAIGAVCGDCAKRGNIHCQTLVGFFLGVSCPNRVYFKNSKYPYTGAKHGQEESPWVRLEIGVPKKSIHKTHPPSPITNKAAPPRQVAGLLSVCGTQLQVPVPGPPVLEKDATQNPQNRRQTRTPCFGMRQKPANLPSQRGKSKQSPGNESNRAMSNPHRAPPGSNPGGGVGGRVEIVAWVFLQRWFRLRSTDLPPCSRVVGHDSGGRCTQS